MAISGPSLEALRAKMQKLASRGFKEQLLLNLAEEARRQIVGEFARSQDPEDVPWKPLKYRSGLPLLDTGRLRNSIKVSPTGTGVQASTNVSYARYHQEGTRTIPARRFFPRGQLGLTWRRAFKRVVDEMVRRTVGR